MLLKTKYGLPRICVDVGPWEKLAICGQIYVLENLTFVNHVDLVGLYIEGEKSPDFRQLLLALSDNFLGLGPYNFLQDLTQNAYVEFPFIKSI
jgi:hypothetical protein